MSGELPESKVVTPSPEPAPQVPVPAASESSKDKLEGLLEKAGPEYKALVEEFGTKRANQILGAKMNFMTKEQRAQWEGKTPEQFAAHMAKAEKADKLQAELDAVKAQIAASTVRKPEAPAPTPQKSREELLKEGAKKVAEKHKLDPGNDSLIEDIANLVDELKVKPAIADAPNVWGKQAHDRELRAVEADPAFQSDMKLRAYANEFYRQQFANGVLPSPKQCFEAAKIQVEKEKPPTVPVSGVLGNNVGTKPSSTAPAPTGGGWQETGMRLWNEKMVRKS